MYRLGWLLVIWIWLGAQAQTLTVLAHDSFVLDKQQIAQFEKGSGVKLRILKGGDAGEMVNKAILTRAAPIADVIYGFDNLQLSKVLAANLLEAYQPTQWNQLSPDLRLDATYRAIPVDSGYVALNYDRAYFAGKPLPRSLRDLTLSSYANLLVVPNPATSSPGLAFLVATVQAFGEQAYLPFWEALRNQGLRVEKGWSEAYYTAFSRNGGDRPLVVSYSTSPAAEMFFADPPVAEPPTGNLLLAQSLRQIEFVGIVRGTRQRAAARQFVDFLLSRPVQQSLPTQMWVYPALSQTPLPQVFQWAPQVKPVPNFTPALTAAHLERWITEWTQVVLQGQSAQQVIERRR